MKWRSFRDIVGYTGLPWWFKGMLLGGAALITLILVYYTQNTVEALKISERQLASILAEQYKQAVEAEDVREITFLFDNVIARFDYPLIISDPQDIPTEWRNLPGVPDSGTRDTTATTRADVLRIMSRMDRHYPAVPVDFQGEELIRLHYGNYALIEQLHRLPYIQLVVTMGFLLAAYVAFRSLKRTEQHALWVGLAKESAHQMGTPITSLLGWLQLVRAQCGTDESQYELRKTLDRMETDITRLNQVANRFGQIGSQPIRKPESLSKVAREVCEYYRERLPFKGEGVKLIDHIDEVGKVAINAELIRWVLENLIKNSLESVDPKTGNVMVTVGRENGGRGDVEIRVTDDGKGIPASRQKRIFQAGFTTKKRGWGLGLTLSRRIIADYHGGRLILEESVPNKITTFAVTLPVKQQVDAPDTARITEPEK